MSIKILEFVANVGLAQVSWTSADEHFTLDLPLRALEGLPLYQSTFCLPFLNPEPISKGSPREWEEALGNIGDFIIQQDLQAFHKRMLMIMMGHLIMGSPVLWVGFVLFFVGKSITTTAYKLKDFLISGLPLLEDQASEAQTLEALPQR